MFAPTGAPIDTHFDLTFMRAVDLFGFRPRTGYVHADQPTLTNYTPSADKQYNSTGGTNRVQRLQIGWYEVVLTGLSTGTGTDHVVITATGNNTASCQVRGWGTRDFFNIVASVRCINPAGNPVDSTFVTEYTRSD